jgi:hypothetical protein
MSKQQVLKLKSLMANGEDHDHEKIRACASELDLSTYVTCVGALTFACIMNCLECVKCCLERGADPHEAVDDLKAFKRTSNECFTHVLNLTRVNGFDMTHFDVTASSQEKEKWKERVLKLECHGGYHVHELLDTIESPITHEDFLELKHKCKRCYTWMVQAIEE